MIGPSRMLVQTGSERQCGEWLRRERRERPARGGRYPRVLWGRKRTLGGGSHLVARRRLWVTGVAGTQHTALADRLQQLAALPSIVDSRKRSA